MPVTNTVPNQDRYTPYTVTSPTSVFPVGFALWSGTLAEAKADLEVRVDGELTEAFTVTGTIDQSANPRVILDASVVLDVAVDDVFVEIEGALQPRRISQYAPGVGVPPRDQNAILNFVVAGLRELKQKVSRAVVVPYGEDPLSGPDLFAIRDAAVAARDAAQQAQQAAEAAAATLTYASQPEAEAGTADNRIMSPLRSSSGSPPSRRHTLGVCSRR